MGGDTTVKEGDLEQRPCDEEHIAEVFFTDTIYLEPIDAPYPGTKAISKIVSGKCRAGYEAYVGVPFRRSELSLTFIYPKDLSWAEGDHGFTCLVGFPDSGAHTGSLKGSKR